MPGPNSKTAGAAVKTFPILLRWGLCTRPGVSSYPIGGRRAAALSDDEKRACVRANAATLYHDLGVVAFDGCSYEQSRRMGDILAKTVALGVVVQTRTAGVAEERAALEAFDIFPALWKLEEETWGHRVEKKDDERE